mgnify:FL=1
MKYTLNIYGTDDEIIKTYSTNIVPWGVFVQAASLQERLINESPLNQIKAIGELLQMLFAGLAEEELQHADVNDVMNTFKQITSGGAKIGENIKNA